MPTSGPFDILALAKRRLTEPEFRRFPSLWETFVAIKRGILDSIVQLETGKKNAITLSNASAALEKFFAERQPHSLYPYVWVRNALNPVPDDNGMHQWVHEVMVSYDKEDMPGNAPIQFDHGQLIHFDERTLYFGKSRRHDHHGRDLVQANCAYVHIGPAARAADSITESEPEALEEESAPR
jgi:hypothetical protein